MVVKKGDKVKVDYTGTFENGDIFDSSTHGDHSHPIEFEVGAGQVIPGFENAVIGMKKGEEKEITIQPEDGYGMPDPNLIRKFPKDQMPKDKELKPNMVLLMNLPNGAQIPAIVKEVDDKEVTLDLNSPLAGKVLKFKIKLVDVEDRIL